jgi:phosphatidylinositol alpha-mannosyltransferase
VAAQYDWNVLARRILAVYETVVPAGGGAVEATDEDPVVDVIAPAPSEMP